MCFGRRCAPARPRIDPTLRFRSRRDDTDVAVRHARQCVLRETVALRSVCHCGDARPKKGDSMDRIRRSLVAALACVLLVQGQAGANVPGELRLWSFKSNGIWRREVRARELARWYRHYEWTADSRIWINRRAEGIWISGRALRTFTCRTHCILQNPRGRGYWRIWRTFSRRDVRRFRKHYRITWVGHGNRALRAEAPIDDLDHPLNRQFVASVDHAEVVTPMEPEDPNPETPFNEAVMIFDENGEQHFLGEEGFELLPDTAMNPDGFQLATTAASTELLPPAQERIIETDMPREPGMAEVQDGVFVEWLVDEDGSILIDRNDDGRPDTAVDALGGQKHAGLVDEPLGEDGNELAIDQSTNPLQLYCALLGPDGEILGAVPGRVVVGPPVDNDGDGEADAGIGAFAPMDPTVRELEETDDGVREVLHPEEKPVDLAIVEEGEPEEGELEEFNAIIADQIPDFQPLRRPFAICIREFRGVSIAVSSTTRGRITGVGDSVIT